MPTAYWKQARMPRSLHTSGLFIAQPCVYRSQRLLPQIFRGLGMGGQVGSAGHSHPAIVKVKQTFTIRYITHAHIARHSLTSHHTVQTQWRSQKLCVRAGPSGSSPLLFPSLEVPPLNPARMSGERCKLCSGSGRNPADKRFWVHFELKK